MLKPLQPEILKVKNTAKNLVTHFKNHPKDLIIGVLAIVVIIFAFVGIKSYENRRENKASDMLTHALNLTDQNVRINELISVWHTYPKTTAGLIALYDLILEQYEAGDYQNALKWAELFIKNGERFPPLLENCLAIKGRIFEELGQYKDAAFLYARLAKDLTGAHLISVKIDQARCLRLAGEDKEALQILEGLEVEGEKYQKAPLIHFMISELKQ